MTFRSDTNIDQQDLLLAQTEYGQWLDALASEEAQRAEDEYWEGRYQEWLVNERAKEEVTL